MSKREGIFVMVDWAILSPAFLAALVEWAGAVVTVVTLGPATESRHTCHSHPFDQGP
jgi:hypothetical protein